MVNRRGFFALTAIGAAGTLTACTTGNGDSTSTARGSVSGQAKGFPVSANHALGTTEVKKAPVRVVTVGWSDADVLASLGVVPVAAPAITFGGNQAKSTDWFDAKVKELGAQAPQRYGDQDGTPVDTVAGYQPDLITGTNSGLDAATYAKLAKIAPTLAYPRLPYGTSWQDSVRMIAEVLGRTSEAKLVTEKTQAQIDGALEQYRALQGKSVAWVYFDPAKLNSITVYTLNDNRPRGLADFGLRTPSFVEKASQNSKTFSAELSAEKAPELDADIVVFDAVDEATTTRITTNPLLSRIPALRNGTFLALGDQVASEAMASPTPLSIPVAITRFLPLLDKAAKKQSK